MRTPPFWILVIIFIVCQVIAFLAFFKMAWSLFANRERAWVIAAPYDYLLNAVTNDMEIQWLSVRAAKARRDGKRWGKSMCWFLDKCDPGHCDKVFPGGVK